MKARSKEKIQVKLGSRRVPLWLRRLDQVKSELKAARFPRTAEQGFRQCVMLSTTALRWLNDSIRHAHPGASEDKVETERRRLLARLSAAEARWLAEWRKERARFFRR
jgi:hypothetical protein